MSTEIPYVDEVWNPSHGCTPISPGCDHCYAVGFAKRAAGSGAPGYDRSDPFKVVCDRSRLDQPRRWKKPRRVLVPSMGDLFHDDVPTAFILDVLTVMAEEDRHTYLLLTKREERMAEILTGAWRPYYPPNVWPGVSAENQELLEQRVPCLLRIPAVGHWVSLEPLLGPVNLRRGLSTTESRFRGASGIDWVVLGGEKGPGSRPMHLGWVRYVRYQCARAGVPFYFKQWGNWTPYALDAFADASVRVPRHVLVNMDGSVMPARVSNLIGNGLMQEVVYRLPAARAGRVLDGVVHDAIPAFPEIGEGTTSFSDRLE